MSDEKLERVNIEYGPHTNNELRVTDYDTGDPVLNVGLSISFGWHSSRTMTPSVYIRHRQLHLGLVDVVLADGCRFIRTQEQVDHEILGESRVRLLDGNCD